jgi:hypothetical protein
MAIETETVRRAEWAALEERVARLERRLQDVAGASETPMDGRDSPNPLSCVAGILEGHPLVAQFEAAIQRNRAGIEAG